MSLVGIRFTTARADAQQALNLLLKQWPERRLGARSKESLTTPLPGGAIESFDRFRREARKQVEGISDESLEALLHNFGTQYVEVLNVAPNTATIPGTATLRNEVSFAIEHEMAVRLDDVIMRRTNLAAGRHPGAAAIRLVADQMASELDWSATRVADEIEQVEDNLAKHFARAPHPEPEAPRASDHGVPERVFA